MDIFYHKFGVRVGNIILFVICDIIGHNIFFMDEATLSFILKVSLL